MEAPAGAEDAEGPPADEVLEALLQRQAQALPSAAAELERHGRKLSHYAWWAFPTDKPGNSEPYPKTFLRDDDTATELLRRAPEAWRAYLELLARKGGYKALPWIDHGRVRAFIAYFRRRGADSPAWLLDVCDRLEETDGKSRFR